MWCCMSEDIPLLLLGWGYLFGAVLKRKFARLVIVVHPISIRSLLLDFGLLGLSFLTHWNVPEIFIIYVIQNLTIHYHKITKNKKSIMRASRPI